MQKCNKWVNNGLPRKGWLFHDLIVHDDINDVCEWCGTNVRFLHILYHPEIDYYTGAGCVCSEKLTEDYINPRKREKEIKSIHKKKETLKKKFFNSCQLSKNGNMYIKFADNIVVFITKDNKTKLIINTTFGKKIYETINDAKEMAFNFLYEKGLI